MVKLRLERFRAVDLHPSVFSISNHLRIVIRSLTSLLLMILAAKLMKKVTRSRYYHHIRMKIFGALAPFGQLTPKDIVRYRMRSCRNDWPDFSQT